MLKHIATFSSFSVDDIQKAKQFYGETLGVEVSEIPEGLDLKLNGNSVFIYPKPNHQPATFTVLNFIVENIDEAVDVLTQVSIVFEHYDNEFMKTDEKGIARMDKRSMAWFKDPAGNFLSVLQNEK